jgi:DNA-binding LacI/PurR family transcriptional regulator
MIRCVKCREVTGIAKAGHVREKQRYYCRHCDYYFTLQTSSPGSSTISSSHHATILDIAKRLEISKSTVSRALRNSSDINQETRDAVLKTARELNYVPNYFASSLVKRKSYSIGIVVPELITNFFSQFIIIAQKAASIGGYEVVICHSNESFSNEIEVLKRLFAYQVDGIILSLSSETKSLDHLRIFQDAGIPLILFNRIKSRTAFPKVVADDYHGAYTGVEHLIKNGYRKIGHIGGPKNLQISKDRLRGYSNAVIQHGLELNPNWIYYHDLTTEGAKKCVRALLENRSEMDAVFAINDPAAIQLIIEAKARGIRVGPDLGIVGFSNDSRSEIIEPSLTTLEQPLEKMAEACIHLLLNKINDPRFEVPDTTIIQTRLIERCSSKKTLL